MVVDDHPLFRSGFVAAWQRVRPQDALLEAGTVREALAVLCTRPITLLIADLRLPDADGLTLCAKVRAASPATITVILTTYDAIAIQAAAEAVGARGFLGKDLPVADLVRAVARLLDSPSARAFPPRASLPAFTKRERQVLGLLLTGESNPGIAERLSVSIETVKSHVSAIFDRLGVEDRFHAVEMARTLGFDVALPHLGDGNTTP